MESAVFFLWLHLPEKNSKHNYSGYVGHSGGQQLVTDYQLSPRFLRRQSNMMARMWSVNET